MARRACALFNGERLIIVSSSELFFELRRNGFEFFLKCAAREFQRDPKVMSMRRRNCRASYLLLHVDAFVILVREPRLLTLTHLDSKSQHRYTLQSNPSIDENGRYNKG